MLSWGDALPLIETSNEVVAAACDLSADHRLSLWDAVIVVHPFAATRHPLLERLSGDFLRLPRIALLSSLMRIALLTGNEARHLHFIRQVSEAGHEILAFTEAKGHALNEPNFPDKAPLELHRRNLKLAQLQVFPEITLTDDTAHRSLPQGAFRDPSFLPDIQAFTPELIVTYGCGIVCSDILAAFPGRVLGSHQGLPQYFRGSGSNFFAVMKGQAGRMGVSVHLVDEGIDTGKIVAQASPIPAREDSYYSYSARLMHKTFDLYLRTITAMEKQGTPLLNELPQKGLLFQRKDFTPEALQAFYAVIESGSFSTLFVNSRKQYGAELLGDDQ